MGSAIVVGGGLAGLTCAWRLARAGHEVEVLEIASEPGGRMRGFTHRLTPAGFVLDAACPVVFEGDANLRSLVASLGLDASLRPLRSAEAAITRDFELHLDGGSGPAGFLNTRLLAGRAKAQLAWVAADLLLHRSFDPFHPTRAESLDAESFALSLGCRGVSGSELLDALLEPLLAELHLGAARDCSRGFALSHLRGRLRRGRRLSFDGGTDVLVRGIAEQVSIRRDCAVISVETETDGARVRYRAGTRTGSAFADVAIIALPGNEVAAICPKLTPAERGFFEKVGYDRGITVHLLFEEAPSLPTCYRVAFPRSAGLGLRSVSFEHTKVGVVPSGSELLAVDLSSDRVGALWGTADDEIERFALTGLARTAIGMLSPTTSVIERRSPASPSFPPGALVRLARFEDRLERSPRLAFTGDYLVGPGAEGAVTSGARAANEIARVI